MKNHTVDILVIGGGINGTGIALDAVGRGLSVILCEQNDLASGTSSKSTKLIHGGLRYLEHGAFKLVHESLNEREVLMKKAPHLISPLTFIIPYQPQSRPPWMIRLGLWIYDHLGHRVTLPGSESVSLEGTDFGAPLKTSFKKGFSYSDCRVDDARLVVENAVAAKALGAEIFTRCRVIRYGVKDKRWEVETEYKGNRQIFYARVLINATGPWIQSQAFSMKLVKGSHIIVPRVYEGEHAYLIQHSDKRVIFAIPYEKHFTLIGTTEEMYEGDPSKAHIDETEKNYLVNAFNEYFQHTLTLKDIVADYSGVRPLIGDGSENPSNISREYILSLDQSQGAPILSVFGGKITTYRRLAEHAMEKISHFFPQMKSAWTKEATLPGGDIPHGSLSSYIHAMGIKYPFLSESELSRLVHCYGTRMEMILAPFEGADRAPAFGDLAPFEGADRAPAFGDLAPFEKGAAPQAQGFYEQELAYSVTHEFTQTADDFLTRRTKLYLSKNAPTLQKIRDWFAKNRL